MMGLMTGLRERGGGRLLFMKKRGRRAHLATEAVSASAFVGTGLLDRPLTKFIVG
jgi:hypothetical protein